MSRHCGTCHHSKVNYVVCVDEWVPAVWNLAKIGPRELNLRRVHNVGLAGHGRIGVTNHLTLNYCCRESCLDFLGGEILQKYLKSDRIDANMRLICGIKEQFSRFKIYSQKLGEEGKGWHRRDKLELTSAAIG